MPLLCTLLALLLHVLLSNIAWLVFFGAPAGGPIAAGDMLRGSEGNLPAVMSHVTVHHSLWNDAQLTAFPPCQAAVPTRPTCSLLSMSSFRISVLALACSHMRLISSSREARSAATAAEYSSSSQGSSTAAQEKPSATQTIALKQLNWWCALVQLHR